MELLQLSSSRGQKVENYRQPIKLRMRSPHARDSIHGACRNKGRGVGRIDTHPPQAAVPLGGMYHMIDFAMRNLMHCGIDRVGIVAQYRPRSPIDYVGVGAPGDFLGPTRGLTILFPHTGKEDSDW